MYSFDWYLEKGIKEIQKQVSNKAPDFNEDKAKPATFNLFE